MRVFFLSIVLSCLMPLTQAKAETCAQRLTLHQYLRIAPITAPRFNLVSLEPKEFFKLEEIADTPENFMMSGDHSYNWSAAALTGDLSKLHQASIMVGLIEPRTSEVMGGIQALLNGDRTLLSFTLSKKYWGKGIMPEALTILMRTLQLNYGITQFSAATETENHTANRVLEKLGFHLVETHSNLNHYTLFPEANLRPYRAVSR